MGGCRVEIVTTPVLLVVSLILSVISTLTSPPSHLHPHISPSHLHPHISTLTSPPSHLHLTSHSFTPLPMHSISDSLVFLHLHLVAVTRDMDFVLCTRGRSYATPPLGSRGSPLTTLGLLPPMKQAGAPFLLL